jgi:aconitate hydratase
MRSNIPMMSHYCYHRYDPDFAERARRMGKSVIIAGENYGQGSSREHAAIVPMYLGVRAVIAKKHCPHTPQQPDQSRHRPDAV